LFVRATERLNIGTHVGKTIRWRKKHPVASKKLYKLFSPAIEAKWMVLVSDSKKSCYEYELTHVILVVKHHTHTTR